METVFRTPSIMDKVGHLYTFVLTPTTMTSQVPKNCYSINISICQATPLMSMHVSPSLDKSVSLTTTIKK